MDGPLATRAAKRLGLRLASCFSCGRQFVLRNKVWVVRVRARGVVRLRHVPGQGPSDTRRPDGREYHLGRYYCTRKCARSVKNEYNERRRQSRTVADVLRVEVPR